jgi:tRNA threonylcarbamoyladenosine biosynthesis protein TsaB
MTTGHDAELAPLVERLLGEQGVKPADIDAVAVVVGPGSFTGVRVGSGFGIGFAAALSIPVAGLTTLEALDAYAPGRSLGVLPAKRRLPDRTWWVQELEDGLGVSPPQELDDLALEAVALGFERIVGGSQDSDAIDGFIAQKLTPGRTSALSAARHLCDKPALLGRSAAPIYVREPDAAPMRPRQ